MQNERSSPHVLNYNVAFLYTGFSPKEGKRILKAHFAGKTYNYQKENDRNTEKITQGRTKQCAPNVNDIFDDEMASKTLICERERVGKKDNIKPSNSSSATCAALPGAMICSEELPPYFLYN